MDTKANFEQEATEATEKKFLIWSVEHGAWWRPDHLGYTRNRPDAGRYSLAEASYICAKANQFVPGVNPPHECMVPEEGLA